MTKQSGRNLIFNIEDDTTAGTFNTLASVTQTSLSINNEPVEITTKGSVTSGGVLYRELLEKGGLQAMTITAEGPVDDVEAYETLVSYGQTNVHKEFQIVENWTTGGNTYEGPFMVGNVEVNGPYNEATTFSVTLESAGEISITATT